MKKREKLKDIINKNIIEFIEFTAGSFLGVAGGSFWCNAIELYPYIGPEFNGYRCNDFMGSIVYGTIGTVTGGLLLFDCLRRIYKRKNYK